MTYGNTASIVLEIIIVNKYSGGIASFDIAADLMSQVIDVCNMDMDSVS